MEDFIILEGGLVANEPRLPVFDLDILNTDSSVERGNPEDPTIAEIIELRGNMRTTLRQLIDAGDAKLQALTLRTWIQAVDQRLLRYEIGSDDKPLTKD